MTAEAGELLQQPPLFALSNYVEFSREGLWVLNDACDEPLEPIGESFDIVSADQRGVITEGDPQLSLSFGATQLHLESIDARCLLQKGIASVSDNDWFRHLVVFEGNRNRSTRVEKLLPFMRVSHRI